LKLEDVQYKLGQIEQKVDNVYSMLETLKETFSEKNEMTWRELEKQADNRLYAEKRIRSLEDYKLEMRGAAAAIALITSAVIGIVGFVIVHIKSIISWAK